MPISAVPRLGSGRHLRIFVSKAAAPARRVMMCGAGCLFFAIALPGYLGPWGSVMAENGSFSVRRGVNVAGPYEYLAPDRHQTGKRYRGLGYYTNWYSPLDLKRAGYDFIRLPVIRYPFWKARMPTASVFWRKWEAALMFICMRV